MTLLAAPAIVRVAASLMPISTAAQAELIGHPLEFTCKDLTLSVERFSERILRPQMIKLARKIDDVVYAELLKAEYPWVRSYG